MPSSLEAAGLLPLCFSRITWMYFISMSRRVGLPSGMLKWGPGTAEAEAGEAEVVDEDEDKAEPGRRTGAWVGRCSGRIGPPPARIVARWIALASSRMLPGHSCSPR